MNRNKFKNGILYTFIDLLINCLKYLNLVEYIKKLSKCSCFLYDNSKESKRVNSRIATDIFIFLKFLLVIAIWKKEADNLFWEIIVWYLLFTNLYTYFYYHVWSNNIQKGKHFDVDRIKRRFLNLMCAITFHFIGFAYLFNVPYKSDFTWSNGIANGEHALLYSISNSFTRSYDVIAPHNSFGNNVAMIEVISAFVFLTIIVSTSVPQIKNK